MSERKRRKKLAAKRPTEIASSLAIGLAVFGFCTQVELAQPVAAVVALVVGVVPFLVSSVVDALDR